MSTPPHTVKRGVSLYSFQEEYFLRTLSLEDCIAAAAALRRARDRDHPGAVDPRLPAPHRRVRRHVVLAGWRSTGRRRSPPTSSSTPSCYPDRWLTLEEQVASFHRDIDIAVRLGAKVIRAIINTPPEVMEGAAPYAEENGVRLLLEVHAPFHYEHPWILQHLEVMHRTGSPALGLMPDMGTFVERFPRVVSERALRDGAKPELVDLIVKTYDDHGDTHALMDIVNYRGGGPVDFGLARQATHYIWTEPKSMLEHMPLIGHIQAKFYEMTEDEVEYSIPYDEIVPVLIEGGFDGYLSSEYEGNRHIQDAFPVDSVEQVRRQHAMFARLLGETGPPSRTDRCSTSTSSARRASAPATTAAPAASSRSGCRTTAA